MFTTPYCFKMIFTYFIYYDVIFSSQSTTPDDKISFNNESLMDAFDDFV